MDPIIVAGFEPFGGRRWNRSWEVVRRMRGRPGLKTLQLPVDYARLSVLLSELAAQRPRAILLVGEAPVRGLRVEQIAINAKDAERPDNTGAKPEDDDLVADGPLALRASWDARALARALTERGIPAQPSFHAGTFACNAALYWALHRRAAQSAIGFLHVPRRRWPVGVRLARLVAAVDFCVDVLESSSRQGLPVVHAHASEDLGNALLDSRDSGL